MFQKFRKARLFFSMFGALTVIFIIIAATSVGFPYKADVAAQRFFVLVRNRLLLNYANDVQFIN